MRKALQKLHLQIKYCEKNVKEIVAANITHNEIHPQVCCGLLFNRIQYVVYRITNATGL